MQSYDKHYKSDSSQDDHSQPIVPIHGIPSIANPRSPNNYFQYMPTTNQKQIQDNIKLLQEHGFIHNKGIYHSFQAKVIYAKNETVIYQVLFGEFQTEISAFCSNIDLQETRQQIGSGNYGKILELKVSKEKLVSKCIHKLQNFMYPGKECLKEVFMVKFASALGIGPLYHTTYCYDILVLKNHCQFLMECCLELNFEGDQAKTEKVKKDMVNSLAILHSLKAVHMDIKPENIAFSPHNKKFVLLDFGFSQLIREKIGEKTWIIPKGTYYFMNEQMKSASILNQKSLIDLYDNDLYGLKETLEMNNSKYHSFFSNKKMVTKDVMTDSFQWSEYIEYFRASYYLGICNYGRFEKLVMISENLPFCFRKLVRQGDIDQKTKTKYVDYLNNSCSKKYGKKQYDEILDLKCADSLLYVQLSKAESESLEQYEKDLNNIEMMYLKQPQKFFVLWRRRGWIDQIFELLFLKKKMQNNERELKQNIIDFISKQKPFGDEHKDLQVLQIFKEEYEIQMNTEHLFQIRYLYESLGFLIEPEAMNEIIWKLVFNSGNEFFYMLNLKYLFCEFILNELSGLSWYPIVPDFLRNQLKNNSLLGICVKVIDELKNINQNSQYCKPTKETFYPLWNSFEELQHFTKNEKALMVIEKLKKLLSHLEYGLIDICYVATNEHENKYYIEEQVKPDIHDPIFMIKRSLIALQKHIPIYLSQIVAKNMITQKISEYCSYDVPIVSRVKSMWQFSQYIQDQNYEKAKTVMRTTLLSPIKRANIIFFEPFFRRYLLKAFQYSNQLFQIFILSLKDYITLKQSKAKLKDRLILTNYILLRITDLWEPLYLLNNQQQLLEELTHLYFFVSFNLKNSLIQNQIDKAYVDKLSMYIDTTSRNLLASIKISPQMLIKSNKKELKLIQDPRMIQLLYEISSVPLLMPCLDSCFCLFQNSAKFFSEQIQEASKKYIVDIFRGQQCLELAIVYMNYQLVNDIVSYSFSTQRRLMEMLEFQIRVSFQLKHTRYLKNKFITYQDYIFLHGEVLHKKIIAYFGKTILSVQSLQETYNNSILIYIIYRSLKLAREFIELQIQKRLVVLICHGLSMFLGQSLKRKIKSYILSLQLLLNQQWVKRKKLINRKRERIVRSASLRGYKKEVLNQINAREGMFPKRSIPLTKKEIVERLQNKLNKMNESIDN